MIRCAVVVLAGCNSILGLGDVRAKPEDAKQFLDAPPPMCTAPTSDYDAFDETTGMPCDTWGYFSHDMCTTTVQNSQLVMTSDPDVTTQATRCGCGALSAIAFLPTIGVFAEVSAVGTGNVEYTQLQAFWEDSSGFASIIGYAGNGMLLFSRDNVMYGIVAYDANSHWWRMRPTDTRDGIAAEVSADGVHWAQFGLDPITPPDQVKLEFITGTFVNPVQGTDKAPTTVTVESINVCP